MEMETAAEFFRAVLAGDAARVDALLERDPQLVYDRSPGGSTALHLATHDGHRGLVAVLLARGADVDAHAFSGLALTPLLVAVTMDRLEVAGLLLDHGADPERTGAAERRPLHLAALRGRVDLVRVLLAHGADVGAIDRAGNTSVAVALQGGHAEVEALLRAASGRAGQGNPPDTTLAEWPSAPVHRSATPGHARVCAGRPRTARHGLSRLAACPVIASPRPRRQAPIRARPAPVVS
jgi:ankyrin repeat protein